jgi:hypothetical protein
MTHTAEIQWKDAQGAWAREAGRTEDREPLWRFVCLTCGLTGIWRRTDLVAAADADWHVLVDAPRAEWLES